MTPQIMSAHDSVTIPDSASPAFELASPCLFLSIPLELRLLIYENLLRDSSRYIRVRSDLRSSISRGSELFPAILRVCKAVHTETLPVLYGTNTFSIQTFPADAQRTLSGVQLVPANAALIRRVFTVAHAEYVFDQEAIVKRYREIGIQWEKLHFWAAYIRAAGKHMPKESDGWLVKPKGAHEVKRFDICSALTLDWSS